MFSGLGFVSEVLTTSGTAADTSGLGAGGLVPVEGGATMWTTIGEGASSFITNVLTPVGTFCTSNEICLAFLSVTFVGLGVRLLRRAIGAFGRGR